MAPLTLRHGRGSSCAAMPEPPARQGKDVKTGRTGHLLSSPPVRPFAGARDRMRAPWIGVLRSRRRMDARFESAPRHDINPKEANVAK